VPKAAPTDLADRYGDPLPAAAFARLGTLRWRQSGEVGSVAFSPDGKLVAAAGTWNVSVRDAETGRELPQFKDKLRGSIVAFSRDGRTLLTAGGPALLQRWDVATGKLLREHKQDRGDILRDRGDFFNVSVAAISPNGKILALTDHRSNALLLDVATGKRLLQIHKDNALLSVALSPDGKTLATGGQDNVVHLWDPATGKELRQLHGHKYWVFAVCFSPDGKTLASVAREDLRLWEVATGRQIRRLPRGGGHLSWSPDGKTIASASKDTIRLWDVERGTEVRQFRGHGSWSIPDLAFSADGKRLVSGGRDHTVMVWDVATGKPLHHFEGHQGAVISLAFAPDGRSLASGGDEDHRIIIWDLATRRPRHILDQQEQWVLCLAWSPDGKTLASGDGNNGTDDREAQVRLWDASSGRLVRQFFGHLNAVQSVAYAPDGKMLATSGWDARTRLWDASSGKRLCQIRGTDTRKILHFLEGSRALLVADYFGGEMALWGVPAGKKLRSLSPPRQEYKFTLYLVPLAGARQVASVEHSGDENARVRFWEVASGRLVRSFAVPGRRSGLSTWAVSPDGKVLAVSEDEYRSPAIEIWDVESGKLLLKLHGHDGSVASLTFSPDGKTLASGSWDTTVLLWDLGQARLVGLWHLLGGDTEEATTAARQLTAAPEGATALLERGLRLAAAAEAPYAEMIVALDSKRFSAREAAQRKLLAAGLASEFALRLTLEGDGISPEVKSRARRALEKVTEQRDADMLRLVSELNGDGAWQAFQRLQKMGDAAEPVLKRALDLPPFARQKGEQTLSPRARSLVQAALERLKEQDGLSLSLQPRRVLRALEVLKRMGTPESRQALRNLAAGPASARVTREARKALGLSEK
jgi:WD40 repeat protein